MPKSEPLHQYAITLATLRHFFAERKVLEVQTPLLAPAGATDPHLHSFKTAFMVPGTSTEETFYLQTSPEFAMKRLLAEGSGDIYQICKAFRNGERGRLHHPEFTIVEWYRVGFDYHKLMDEVDDLLISVLNTGAAERRRYSDLFLQSLSINPHTASVDDLKQCAKKHNIAIESAEPIDDTDTWLEYLFSHCIEPTLGFDRPVFVYDYPPTQAMLAAIRPDTPPVAERFEVYVKGVELANGFTELTDAKEQRRRFENDNAKRTKMGLETMPIDEPLLAAIEQGLPACAGVALGLDRLIMLITKKEDITGL